MKNQKNEALKYLLHPYLFALKEGKHIKENPLDYSLLMLQVSRPQVLRAPKTLLTNLVLQKKQSIGANKQLN